MAVEPSEVRVDWCFVGTVMPGAIPALTTSMTKEKQHSA
jgi:hypothetical protein